MSLQQITFNNYEKLKMHKTFIKFLRESLNECFAIYGFQRYIEKDFGINRHVINNLNDVDEALTNGETEWLNVFIDYIEHNKLWLETMLTKLDDKPQHVELKTKAIRYLNKLNNERGDIGL